MHTSHGCIIHILYSDPYVRVYSYTIVEEASFLDPTDMYTHTYGYIWNLHKHMDVLLQRVYKQIYVYIREHDLRDIYKCVRLYGNRST
jgi:hypothetical protein